MEGYKSLYESVFSAITSIIDRQIDQLEKQRDAAIKSYEEQKESASEYYESQIEEIDKQIDKINEAKDARKAEMDIQKSLYDLIRSQNQRTIGTLDESGNRVYKTNPNDIRDNRNNYQDAKDEKAIQKLEKQREEFERLQEESDKYWSKLIDNTNEYYDNLIQGLEDYKSRWEELAEMEEQAKMLALLEEFGYTEEDILNMSEDAFQDLKKQYLQVLKDMNAGNGGVLKHLSDISGVDMTQLEGHLQATADTTATFGEELKTVVEELDKVCKGIENVNKTFSDTSGIKTYGEILNEFILKAQEAAKKAAELKATQESIYNNGEAPFQGTYDTTGKSDDNKEGSSKSSSDSKSTVSTNTNKTTSSQKRTLLEMVNRDDLVLVPVEMPKWTNPLSDSLLPVSNTIIAKSTPNIVNHIPKSLNKVDNTKNVQISQNISINAPYLTNENGYNRLVKELRGLKSEAIYSAINNK